MELEDFIYMIIGLIITCTTYMIYPFIRVKIMKYEYTEETCNKMAMWNSIIVGFIYLVLTSYYKDSSVWNVSPAFLYYFINKQLWFEERKKNKNKDYYICSNCGTIVNLNDQKCHCCGEQLEENDK